jgi:Ca2+-binding EF-hand superfamily protein
MPASDAAGGAGGRRNSATSTTSSQQQPAAVDYDGDGESADGDAARVPAVLEVLTPPQVDTLRDLFTVFDQQGLGFLHPTELRVALRMAECEVTRDTAHALIATHCADPAHGFTVEEFLSVVDELVRSRPAGFRRNFLESVFASLDGDGAGDLDAAQLERWAADVANAEAEAELALGGGASGGHGSSPPVRDVHAAPDRIALEPLGRELARPGGLEGFMKDLGMDPSSRLTRQAFMDLFIGSETIL